MSPSDAEPAATDALTPMTSAMHGITASQNVTRAVAERVQRMAATTRTTRVLAWGFLFVPAAGVAALFATSPLLGIGALYFAAMIMPIGAGVHWYARRAYRHASQLDRERDVAWVSPREGLVFFGDEGVFVEKRGGFKPYAAPGRRYTDVSVSAGVLQLHGMDLHTGARYSLEVTVPSGWTDADTARIRAKLDMFR